MAVLDERGTLIAVDGLVRVTSSGSSSAESPRSRQRLAKLSSREGEVLELAALGLTDTQIARVLELSPRTIERHMRHVFFKLGVSNRTAAVAKMLTVGRSSPTSSPA